MARNRAFGVIEKNWNITAVFQPHEGQVPSMKQHACANFYMGISATTHTHTQADFKLRCKIVKERMLQKEKEVKGKWWTKEKMVKSGEYSP